MEMEEDSSSHRLWKWKRTIEPPLMETGENGIQPFMEMVCYRLWLMIKSEFNVLDSC